MPSSWHKRNREFTRRPPGAPRNGQAYIKWANKQRSARARDWWKPRSRDRGPAKMWTEQHQGKRHGLTVTRVAIMLAIVIIVVMVLRQFV